MEIHNKTEKLISVWKKNYNSQSQEMKEFLFSLRAKEREAVFATMLPIHQGVFSDMDCLQCANCCTTTPPIYTQKDIRRIAAYLKITPRQFRNRYTIEDVNGEWVGIKVPCSFLKDDHSCSIYEVRPEACRTYPHTDDRDFSLRPAMNLKNTQICPAAFAIVQQLMTAMKD